MRTPVVSPEELAAERTGVRLFDARAGATGAASYLQLHLSGALRADPERDLAAPREPRTGGRHPLPELERWCRRLGEWGVTPDLDVVVYDDQGGANAAARMWWMLRAVGHRRVAILDGGWHAALAAGLPTDADLPAPATAPPYPATAWRLPTCTADEVEARRADPAWRVIDVRAPARYRGEHDAFDPIAGHIPGAINLPYPDNLGADGRFHSAETLRARFEAALGTATPDQTIVHCGSGITACHTLVALELAGLPDAALYVGSWSEWCRQERPRGTGAEP